MAKRAKGFYDKDMGYKQLMTTFAVEEGEQAVFVGWLRSSGLYKPKDGKGKSITIAQIATMAEFGAPGAGIPERAPVRSAMDANQGKLNKLILSLCDKILEGVMTKKNALGIIGETAKGMIKSKIQAGLEPGLKHRKGKPYIDTGQTINSIEWEVK